MSVTFSLADCLQQQQYFRHLSQAHIERLAAQAVVRRVAAGEIVFLQGDRSAGLWVVEKGRLKIYRLSPEGREHILLLIGPGDSFNEVSALDGGPNPASVEVLSDSVLWVLPTETLQDVLREDPELPIAILAGLSERMRGLVDQIEMLALLSVSGRLARFLLAQSRDPSLAGPGITRAAIAAHLATTPETISRALRALEDAGAIRFDRHRIVIVDEDLLADLGME